MGPSQGNAARILVPNNDAPRKNHFGFVAKLAVSAGILAFIGYKMLHRENAEDLFARLANLSVPWLIAGFAAQLLAMGCSIVRWRLLLRGQGIHAKLPYLIRSFWVGRFFSAVSPGGWTGLDAFRIYEISRVTEKPARATATVLVDKLLGQAAFGSVIVLGSVFGFRYLGTTGVFIVDGAFLGLIAVVLLLLSKPSIFRAVSHRFPEKLRQRIQTTVDAVCAYQGRSGLLLQAVLLSMGTHALTNLIYVASARALGSTLAVGDVFFVSSMQVLATLLPLSINGVGIREATAVKLYAMVGVATGEAVLIPILGFAIDMIVSSLGGLLLLLPQNQPEIAVDNADHENAVNAQIVPAKEEAWPKRSRAIAIGFGAGLFAGIVVGLAEAVVIVISAAGKSESSVLVYGTVVYGLACGAGGAAALFASAQLGRWMAREAANEARTYARTAAAIIALPALAITAFRIRRDVYAEELVWKSPHGLAILGGVALGALVCFFLFSIALRFFVSSRAGSWMLRPWGTPVFGVVVAALVMGIAPKLEKPKKAVDFSDRAMPEHRTGNVLFIVVDTLRADHLKLYGYTKDQTPNLDHFAHDAIRFENAFSNASWTRPSFATILSGRYPSSHHTMAKSESLPEELTTMPEALQSGGYATYGLVTNFNVAPFFNFDQGFDEYDYLEPDFVLGANDTAAKLLFIQFARQQIETLRAKLGRVEPGSAYRDAQTVNASAFHMLDGMPKDRPWFFFLAYMDPHDPYFEHPYRGSGYGRAAHPNPDMAEQAHLTELYDGEIHYWDENFGKLIEDLKRRGLYDKLTIVVTADHGEELGDHGGFWHGQTLYDEQLRVPLFIKFPYSQHGGATRMEWAQHVDLMPTILHLAGLPIPEGVQGHPTFDPLSPHGEAFAEESQEGNVLSSVRVQRAASEIKIITANPGNPRGLDEEELFRVDVDRHERVNLLNELPWERQLLETRLQSSEHNASQGAVSGSSVSIGADEAQRLEALGYAGSDTAPPPKHK